MENLESAVGLALDRLVGDRRPVLAAVSGGPDSMALLRALQVCCRQRSIELTAAHLDHQLRPASADDAAWLAGECDRLRIPLAIDSQRVSPGDGGGVEESARRARYEFLARTAADRKCPFVAVGHTADDQAETVLHHVIRGTGLDGLRGIPEIRKLTPGVHLIRPLIGTSRAEVLDYLSHVGQTFREDETNADPRHTRNRIRTSLLPLLREQFNPRIDEALLRLAQHAADAGEFIRQQAEELRSSAAQASDSSTLMVDCTHVTNIPHFLLCEVLRSAWRRQGWREGEMTQSHWHRLAQLAKDAGASITLPGPIQATRRGNLLVMEALPSGDLSG